jgi:hypothetical protein
MITQLKTRYQAVCAAAGQSADTTGMTVVFDAGQNSEANFAHLAAAGLGYIGSVPASDCPDLTALPASVRTIVDTERFGGLTACETRRVTYGTGRRTVLTQRHGNRQAPGVRRVCRRGRALPEHWRRPGGSRAGRRCRCRTRTGRTHRGPTPGTALPAGRVLPV